MLRFKNQVTFGVALLVLLSCSIVKDSDITSLAQLNALSLKSFEIVQNSQAGNSSALATLKYDSVVNRVTSSTGARISRVKGFALPALGNYKMKLKSGTNAATVIKIEYLQNNAPNRLFIYQGDSLIEYYRFYYNSKNQLLKFVIDIDPIDNKPEVLHIKDSMVYPASNVYPNPIIRKSSDAALNGNFTLQTCSNCGGSLKETINPIIFNSSYQINFNSGSNCNSSNYYPYSCGGVSKTSTGSGGSNGNQNQLTFQNNFTFDKTLQTLLTSASNTDTYYFHPLLILKDLIPEGSLFFWFYSVDWFQTTGTTNNSDMVKINFNYGK